MGCELIIDSVQFRYPGGHEAIAGIDLRMTPDPRPARPEGHR